MIALAVAAALAPSAHSAAVKNVAVRDDYFSPKSVTIHKGSKVRWRWGGKSYHNVSVAKGPVKFHSSLQRSGSYTKRLRRKGTYRILCTVHPADMKMTIRVR